jgi:hypothetical protein
MARRQTKEEFLEKANLLHNFAYDYSQVEYVNSRTKVTVICKLHGGFLVTPKLHVASRKSRGSEQPSGCPDCGELLRRRKLALSNTKTTSWFIDKAREVHGFRYNYEKTIYVKAHERVTITCPKHGDFNQLAFSHLQGRRCYDCGLDAHEAYVATHRRGVSTGPSKRKGVSPYEQSEFFRLCAKRHKDKYDYSDTVFMTTNRPIEPVCKEHGKFKLLASEHLRGRGCRKCGRRNQGLKKRIPFSKWLRAAHKIHRKTYEYDKTSYRTTKDSIRIKCKKHGWFEQNAARHIYLQHGCEDCANERVSILRSRKRSQFISESRSIHKRRYKYHLLVADKKTDVLKTDCKGRVKLYCVKHGEVSIHPNNHIHLQQGCAICVGSKGVRRIADFLKELKIGFISEWTDHDCIYKQRLRFDFFLPDHDIVIEFDGVQHFEPVSFGSNESEAELEEKFKGLQMRDGLKDAWCKENNIGMIRIPYYEEPEVILTQHLLHIS